MQCTEVGCECCQLQFKTANIDQPHIVVQMSRLPCQTGQERDENGNSPAASLARHSSPANILTLYCQPYQVVLLAIEQSPCIPALAEPPGQFVQDHDRIVEPLFE